MKVEHGLGAAWLRVVLAAVLGLVLVIQVRSCQTRPTMRPLGDVDFQEGGAFDPDRVELGRLLFFDQELSGNRNISCATCHHPLLATTDGLALPIGEGGEGVGPERSVGSGPGEEGARIPRNALSLFNLGALEFRFLFYDGRFASDPSHPSGFATPAGLDLPTGLETVLSVQALFPPVSPREMAGQPGENEVADAVYRGDLAGEGGAWELLARRLRAIPEYVDLFVRAYDDVVTGADITMVHAANAIGTFEASAFRTDDSPFDRYLRGDSGALDAAQLRGMALFYGEGGRCSHCHSGPLQTDQGFHSTGMPQLGPGTGGGVDGRDDFGRAVVTGEMSDVYRFRTPSLRNVELTGPWGHAGAYRSLEAAVEHYRDVARGVRAIDPDARTLPSDAVLEPGDLAVMNDPGRAGRIAASSDATSLSLAQLSTDQISDLVAFLQSLTDPRARDLSGVIPDRVPSGRLTQGPAGGRDR